VVNKIAVVLLLMFIFLAGNSSASWGYEEERVLNGGSLKGTVYLEGRVPPARVYHLIFSPNIEYCRRISDGIGNRLLHEFKTSPDGGFEDVVISLVGVKKGKPFNHNPIIWLEDCQIRPFVTPIRNNHPVTIANNDPVFHDIQGYTLNSKYTFQMFNKPVLEKSNVQEDIKFRRGHYIFRTQCGVHDYMQSWGIAVGNPYFDVTNDTGEYEISNIPPGTYHLLAWHPNMEIQAQTVTIKAKETVEIGFVFDAKEVNIPAHDLQTSYRLQTWLQDGHLVPPKVKKQTHNSPEDLLVPLSWEERSKFYLGDSEE